LRKTSGYVSTVRQSISGRRTSASIVVHLTRLLNYERRGDNLREKSFLIGMVLAFSIGLGIGLTQKAEEARTIQWYFPDYDVPYIRGYWVGKEVMTTIYPYRELGTIIIVTILLQVVMEAIRPKWRRQSGVSS